MILEVITSSVIKFVFDKLEVIADIISLDIIEKRFDAYLFFNLLTLCKIYIILILILKK